MDPEKPLVQQCSTAAVCPRTGCQTSTTEGPFFSVRSASPQNRSTDLRKKERERESKAAITTSNKKLRTLEAIAPRVSRPLLVAADGRFRKGGGTRGRVRKGRPGPTSGGPRGAEFHRGTRDEEDLART